MTEPIEPSAVPMGTEHRCNLTKSPNEWGCHDPQCGDSTWDHECPVGPCTAPASTTPPAVTPVAASGADSEPERAALRERIARAIADECRGNGGWPEGGGVYDRAERDHWHACADRVFEVLGDG